MSTNSTTFKGRIKNKHGTEERWLKSVFQQDGNGNITDNLLSTPFVPLDGELIIYDPDSVHEYFRFKFGDGKSNVDDLPFVGEDHPVTSVFGRTGAVTLNKSDVTTALGYTPPKNNTTYDLAASKSSTNGNVKLNLTAGGSGSGTDSVTIKGTGGTTVTTDANGVVTIDSSAIPSSIVTVDDALSNTSENPVQNKVINTALNNKLTANGWSTHSSSGALVYGVNDSKQLQIRRECIYLMNDSEQTETILRFPTGNKNSTIATLEDIPTVPTKLSDLADDASHRIVTDTEKAAWNAKSNFSGNYNDLTNKPTIPTNTDTTYDLGASKSSTNGNVKLNLVAGGSGSGTDSVTIKGTGGTTVTTDTNGVVTINSSATTSSSVTVDSALSSTSTNPVQNKVVNAALNNKLTANGWSTNSTGALVYGANDSKQIQIRRDYIYLMNDSERTTTVLRFPTGNKDSTIATIEDINTRVPTPTSSDKGKFLKVNNSGVAQWTAIASAESATF